MTEAPDGRPAGEIYDWYRRGLTLLRDGNPQAAAQVLRHVTEEEPDSRSAREALARAEFDSGHYEQAREGFRRILDVDPADDYAQYGFGLCAARLGDLHAAVQHLSMAATMRPDNHHYGTALRAVQARRAAGE